MLLLFLQTFTKQKLNKRIFLHRVYLRGYFEAPKMRYKLNSLWEIFPSFIVIIFIYFKFLLKQNITSKLIILKGFLQFH